MSDIHRKMLRKMKAREEEEADSSNDQLAPLGFQRPR